MAGRYGLRRYRLIVFPPGINTTDRRLLRLWRGWPVGGAMLAIVTVILLGGAVASTRVTLSAAAAAYVGMGAVLFVRTAGARAGARSLLLILPAGELEPRERRSYTEWEMMVGLLTRADSLLTAGAIDFVQHEALWWQAYDRLEVLTRV